jgi:hypothetical protein
MQVREASTGSDPKYDARTDRSAQGNCAVEVAIVTLNKSAIRECTITETEGMKIRKRLAAHAVNRQKQDCTENPTDITESFNSCCSASPQVISAQCAAPVERIDR